MSPSQTSRPLRLLASLSPDERASFFPAGDIVPELHFPHELFWSAATTETSWHQEVARFQPEAILGAWSTHLLPVPEQGLPTRYYCHFAGSVRRVVPRELLGRGLFVTNWGDAMACYVAEAALALTLAALRNLASHQVELHVKRGWRVPDTAGRSLFGRRIGLHGFGAIAREFVQLVKPFRPELMAFDPFVPASLIEAHGVAVAESVEALFARSDVLVELCALTSETCDRVDEALLRRLPSGGVFVNVARGQLVDEAALARLVAETRLAAALDVYRQEPLPADSPLRGLRGAVLTPHVGGNLRESRRAAAQAALGNLHRFAAGQPLRQPISLEQYDRMT